MKKTGREVFHDEIFLKIDRSIKIKSIVEEGFNEQGLEFIIFSTCDYKWLRVNNTIEDIRGEFWGVIEITGTNIKVLKPSGEAELNRNEKVLIPPVFFKSGTPMNLNEENKLKERADVLFQTPIVWLLETIKGRDLEANLPYDTEFDFTYYCLEYSKFNDWLNERRHFEGVKPMTQLSNEIKRVIDLKRGMIRIGDIPFRELNRFGREQESGFTDYILGENLSGTENRATVQFKHDMCNC